MFKDKNLWTLFACFVLLNAVLYFTMTLFHTKVPFDVNAYSYNSHHYVQDARVNQGEFSFIRALGVWDAQWYLRIADAGYPPKSVFDSIYDPHYMGGLTYAFFPFYPLIIFTFNLVFNNVEVSAFVVSLVLLAANFFSLYYVVTKLFSSEIAAKTILLLFLFPFGVFFRSYYTESIFMLLIIWLTYFTIKKKWFYSAVVASLLFISRPNGLAVGAILFVSMLHGIRHKSISWYKAVLYGLMTFLPFSGWLFFNYVQTDNPFYWHHIQSIWYKGQTLFSALDNNLEKVFTFFSLHFHTAHESQLDTAMIFIVFILLLVSRKYFKKYPQLWWLCVIIWIFPLLVKDTMSFSRFQTVSFPLFIFLAAKVNGWKFYALCGIFFGLLLYTSMYFINWRWIG